MKPNNKKLIDYLSRRKFLSTCGSIVAGGTILGVSGVLLHKIFMLPVANRITPDDAQSSNSGQSNQSNHKSPYKFVSSFKTSDRIEGFDVLNDRVILAASNVVSIYDYAGSLLTNFPVASNIRDVVVANDMIYLLFPTRIEVYSMEGDLLHDWEACSEESDYCAFAVAPESVFVTDAGSKNICKYTSEGTFVKFIQSPEGFIVPSYSFGITYANGSIFCSNPGRHKVENYTLEGEFVASFGKPGDAEGSFSGCCNPVYLTYNAAGEIITSEKGNPRICCYTPKGEFRSVLLDSQSLGGGHAAYDIKIVKDKLVVAGEKTLSIYQYDANLATKTACSTCDVDCPLRKGITI